MRTGEAREQRIHIHSDSDVHTGDRDRSLVVDITSSSLVIVDSPEDGGGKYRPIERTTIPFWAFWFSPFSGLVITASPFLMKG